MYKATKTLRALGRVAPIALAVAMMAPATQAVEQQDSFWFAAGDRSFPEGQLWVNSAGECWQSAYPDGPKNLPPCAAPKVVVAESVTVRLNFEFDKYEVPRYVVNKEEVALIDQYIRDIQATPETEVVTVTGHIPTPWVRMPITWLLDSAVPTPSAATSLPRAIRLRMSPPPYLAASANCCRNTRRIRSSSVASC
jgi:hypothetical protein